MLMLELLLLWLLDHQPFFRKEFSLCPFTSYSVKGNNFSQASSREENDRLKSGWHTRQASWSSYVQVRCL
ncbi:hypothetical protein MLD38_031244 [Melastoma candidum]|uniref:Uncharacterized protein n=1 Tax=Melastoma candidum TaxID=119954 RepID=A0ACB9MTZ1_9MYRT|nr:hypothetical protein MLD38_031244 [Melastoma candidum]